MKAPDRRKAIVNRLLSATEAVTGSALSEEFGVSRQIIVRDITALKNAGCDILSTHNGYVVEKSPLKERVFKLHHTTQQTEDELGTVIELGGVVVDVFVWHKVYGKLTALLNISTNAHIKKFIDGVRSGKSVELMHITGGYHYHTIRADSECTLDLISDALENKGYIAPEI